MGETKWFIWRIMSVRLFLSSRLKSTALLCLLTLASWPARSAPVLDEPLPYYGKDFYDDLAQNKLHDEELKNRLQFILTSFHMARSGEFDEISTSCRQGRSCAQQKNISYTEARYMLFGKLHLEVSPGGNYQLRTMYCEETLDSSRFRRGQGIGPNQIPDANVVNVEHAWPQSKFNRRQPINSQKTDLHILFPVLTNVNSLRGNHPFGEVTNTYSSPCPDVKLGHLNEDPSELYFEPPQNQRGNLARALFYFSVRYKAPIDPIQEEFLRRWNHEDPVEPEERERNEKIYGFQKTRNPFIDHPELADLISNF